MSLDRMKEGSDDFSLSLRSRASILQTAPADIMLDVWLRSEIRADRACRPSASAKVALGPLERPLLIWPTVRSWSDQTRRSVRPPEFSPTASLIGQKSPPTESARRSEVIPENGAN